MKIKYDLRTFLRKRFGKAGLTGMLKNLIKSRDDHAFFYKMLFMVCIILAISILLINLNKTQHVHNKGKEGISSDKSINTEGMILKDVTVVVDAGHGGNDWGTHSGNIKEKNLNLDIALRLGKLLKEKKIRVIYTRNKDKFVSLLDRPKIANDSDSTLFISIHNNNLPGNTTHSGTETLYASLVSARFKNMNDKKLAEIVEKELTEELGTSNGGIIKRPDLAVLHRTKMPAVISEIGYLSNLSDRSKLTSKNFRQKAAEALCSSLMKALSDMGAYKNSNGIWKVYEIDKN